MEETYIEVFTYDGMQLVVNAVTKASNQLFDGRGKSIISHIIPMVCDTAAVIRRIRKCTEEDSVGIVLALPEEILKEMREMGWTAPRNLPVIVIKAEFVPF